MFSAMVFFASVVISQLKQTIGLMIRPLEMNNTMTYPKYDGFGRKIDGNDDDEVKGRLDVMTTREEFKGEKRKGIYTCIPA
jgi:hypothetical protein